MFNAKNNYYSLETMKEFEAETLQDFKEVSKEFKEIGDMANHWFYESLIETIDGEYMGSALVCMQQAAKLGHDKAQFVIETIESQNQPPQVLLLTNFIQFGQSILNSKDKSLKERYPDGMSLGEEMIPISEMLSSGNTKDARQLLAKLIEKGSFHAYILLQGPTLKDRS